MKAAWMHGYIHTTTTDPIQAPCFATAVHAESRGCFALALADAFAAWQAGVGCPNMKLHKEAWGTWLHAPLGGVQRVYVSLGVRHLSPACLTCYLL
jgi:hypothetical protein